MNTKVIWEILSYKIIVKLLFFSKDTNVTVKIHPIIFVMLNLLQWRNWVQLLFYFHIKADQSFFDWLLIIM